MPYSENDREFSFYDLLMSLLALIAYVCMTLMIPVAFMLDAVTQKLNGIKRNPK